MPKVKRFRDGKMSQHNGQDGPALFHRRHPPGRWASASCRKDYRGAG